MDLNDVLQALSIRMEELRDAVTSLESRLEERCPNHGQRIVQIETILHGAPQNGKNPGLVSRVGSIDSAIRRYDRARSWAYAVAGAALGGLVATLVERLL